MKKIALLLLVLSTSAFGSDVWVNGYTRQDGTYVEGHYRTAPDNNAYNNYNSQGNTNPYTGQQGTRDPNQVQQQYAPQTTNGYQPMPTLSPAPTYNAPGNNRGSGYQH